MRGFSTKGEWEKSLVSNFWKYVLFFPFFSYHFLPCFIVCQKMESIKRTEPVIVHWFSSDSSDYEEAAYLLWSSVTETGNAIFEQVDFQAPSVLRHCFQLFRPSLVPCSVLSLYVLHVFPLQSASSWYLIPLFCNGVQDE